MISQIALYPETLSLSRLILGVWRMVEWQQSPQETLSLIQQCVDLGITTFDHADLYGDYNCEGLFGDALKLNPASRSRIQLVTKCGIKLVSKNRPEHKIKHYDTSYNHILQSVEHSLQQLHTDYLDLLLIHRPDPLMDADQVAAAFTELKQSGKVQYFGVSNFSPSQFDLLASRLDFPLVTNQIEISVMHLDAFTDGTLEHLQRLRAAPMAWSPLGGGQLFGNSPKAVRLQKALAAVAQQLDATLDQVALAWLLVHPSRILPILGTGNLNRIESATKAEQLNLTREQWFSIWTASTNKEVP
ncbi:aldo/keto reductase [Leptolyngbya sp. NK1-12]|uniref:Aldo/keto reductase n=1 Tax=Leptolyngbya sp. NK1-12 TaxID=2547451 RepID=A0AA96WKZ0_9CYAN|nr:aldo/keto reductase [Leptolyngbya sp. NK1-12]WNZ27034.1 aldo/keto reductase [Leptolyngbya sp. NK1-12]